MSAEPTNTRAIRTRAIAELGEDWQMLSRDPTLYRDNIPMIHFVTEQQIKDADGDRIMEEVEDRHPDRSGHEYENLFLIRIDDLLSWALEHGFLDALPDEQRMAIRAHVKVDLSRED